MKPRITDLSLPQLEALLKSWGQPAYRARQIFKWVYQRLAVSFDEMTDLPVSLRQKLIAETTLLSLKPIDEVVSDDGRTTKILFGLEDGQSVESVLMLYDDVGEGKARNTVCVSTQVGCPMNCPFCATGQQGFARNLTSGEILGQVLYFQRSLIGSPGVKSPDENNGVTNIVFMGMGEPLANYDAVRRSIEVMTAKEGFGFSPRRITISTSGLAPQIKRLAAECPVELAVSLHAPNNQLRNTLVPANQKFPLDVLMSAVGEYFAKTGRRPTYEYILFDGINDSTKQARELVALLRGLNCIVNLIPANQTDSEIYVRPSPERVARFQHELNSAGIQNTIRQSRGGNIGAACGQLRSQRNSLNKH